ncbi:hypothetical protein GUJ93_ZPchr0010g8105 [Zizania palustris]|uniref:Uncharacterized protein n=1 Tax=Zizania palustris TaxID=103762 RepID=A0A8J5WAU2_ZIZPA|nr:hypothetical protein GUJ93_ZPchr0010g8105 [Zizania palustris]
MRPPTPLPEPYDPSTPDSHPPYVLPSSLTAPEAIPELADDLEFGFSPPPLPLLGWVDLPLSSTASSSFCPERAERYHPVISRDLPLAGIHSMHH